MTYINSEKFFSRGLLPEIEVTVPVREVFARISKETGNGFVLTQSGRPYRYVVGKSLVSSFLQRTQPQEDRTDVIGRFAESRAGSWISSPDILSFPIETAERTKTTLEQLENRPDMVFEIVDAGTPLGFYLNHENVLNAATGRIVWVCKQGHDNADPDHGTCAVCPFPIDHVEVR
jgi:hypothetical protein